MKIIKNAFFSRRGLFLGMQFCSRREFVLSWKTLDGYINETTGNSVSVWIVNSIRISYFYKCFPHEFLLSNVGGRSGHGGHKPDSGSS